MATIAALHRIGGRRQQLVIKKRQGFFQSRGEHFFEGVANPLKPVDPMTQLVQLAQGRLHAATPVKQRLDMLHDLAEFTQLGQAPGDVQELLAFAWLQTTFDKQEALLE